MAEDKDEDTPPSAEKPREPEILQISAKLTGEGDIQDIKAALHEQISAGLRGEGGGENVDLGWGRWLDLTRKPLGEWEWLKARVDQLKASPDDSVKGITDISYQIEDEISEATRRGQCRKPLNWSTIKNALTKKVWWARRR